MNRTFSPPFPWTLLRFWLQRISPMWCFIALIIFLVQIAVCAIVHDNQNVRAFLQFIELLPSIVKSALGGETLRMGNVAALLAIGYQHPLVLFLCLLYAVGVPAVLLTREIQNGTMELILSRPATKAQVFFCAAFIALAGMFAIVAVMFLGTIAGTNLFTFSQPVPLDLFFRIAINGGLLAATVGAVALLAAGAFPGRHAATAASVVFIVLNYFAGLVAQWWPRMNSLKPFTLFHYVNGDKLSRGWPVEDMAVLATILIVAVTIATVVWQRRDLPC